MDQETFKNTIFLFKDKMYRFAKRILMAEDEAYDLVQELMLKLWQNRENLSLIANKEAYLMRMVKNEALNKVKKVKVVALFQAQLLEGVHLPQDSSITKEMVLHFIAQLPEKQRLVIHLRDIEEYEVSEIAKTMDMDERAVRVNLMRARQKMKVQLQKIIDYEKRQVERYQG